MMPNRTVEERVHALEVVVTAMSDKNADVGHLSAATEELAKSTGRVENALAAAASAQETAREAKADAAGTLSQLASSERDYRRRSRVLAGTALAVSLLVTGGATLFITWFIPHNADRTTAATNAVRYDLCLARAKYDQNARRIVAASIAYDRHELGLVHANRATTEAVIRSLPRAQRRPLRAEERDSVAALRTKLAVEQRAYKAGIVGHCGSLPH